MNIEQEVPVHRRLGKQPSVPQQETGSSSLESRSAPALMSRLTTIEEETVIRTRLVEMHKLSGEVVSAMQGSERKLQAQNETLQQQVAEMEKAMTALRSELKVEHQKTTELEKMAIALQEENIQLKADCNIQHQKVAELEKVNSALKEKNSQQKDSLEKKVDSLSTVEEEKNLD